MIIKKTVFIIFSFQSLKQISIRDYIRAITYLSAHNFYSNSYWNKCLLRVVKWIVLWYTAKEKTKESTWRVINVALVTHVSQLIALSNRNWLFWYVSSCCFSHDEVVTSMVHVGWRQQWKDNFMYICYCSMFFKVLWDGSEFSSANGVVRNIGKNSNSV